MMVTLDLTFNTSEGSGDVQMTDRQTKIGSIRDDATDISDDDVGRG